jgi:hypothetical protein
MARMRRSIGLFAACWWLIVALGAMGIGVRDSGLTPGGLVLALLLIVAPAALAIPAGRRLVMPLWALETIGCWAALGILVALVDPGNLSRPLALVLILPLIFFAAASPALPLAAWRFPDQAGAVRRRGYAWAALPTGLLLLRGLDALDPLIILIICAIAFLVILLRRSAGVQPVDHTETTSNEATIAESAATILKPAVAVVGRGQRD